MSGGRIDAPLIGDAATSAVRPSASGMDTARLVADVGGTNARFAWQAGPGAPLTDVATLSCAAHDTLEAAIRTYLASLGRSAPPRCAIGIANPVVGDQVRMTNHHWSFSISGLQSRLGMQQLLVINDFTALALALPHLRADELRQVGGAQAVPGAAIGLIGPGTGLGVSGLLPAGPRWVPLAGEGGHVSLAATNEHEEQVLAYLRRTLGHVSAERAVSGPGLPLLYEAVAALWSVRLPQPCTAANLLTPAAIVDAALTGADEHAVQALQLFCAFLGNAAGNLALTLGARGGVYIGGGIVPRLGRWLDQSPFRARFEAKGRFQSYLQGIPVFVIHADPSPALLGAAQAFDAI